MNGRSVLEPCVQRPAADQAAGRSNYVEYVQRKGV